MEWVRAYDLLTRGGARLSGLGARGHEAAARAPRAGFRRGMAAIGVAVSRRGAARRSAPTLPPVGAFGQIPPGAGPGTGRAVAR